MSTEDKETVDNMISYYRHHTVEKIAQSHLGFVVDDFSKLLGILENANCIYDHDHTDGQCVTVES